MACPVWGAGGDHSSCTPDVRTSVPRYLLSEECIHTPHLRVTSSYAMRLSVHLDLAL